MIHMPLSHRESAMAAMAAYPGRVAIVRQPACIESSLSPMSDAALDRNKAIYEVHDGTRVYEVEARTARAAVFKVADLAEWDGQKGRYCWVRKRPSDTEQSSQAWAVWRIYRQALPVVDTTGELVCGYPGGPRVRPPDPIANP